MDELRSSQPDPDDKARRHPDAPALTKAQLAFETDDLHANLTRRTAVGGMIMVGGQIISMLIQIVNLAIMSRLLAPSDFGIVAMSTVVTAFAQIFVGAGMSTVTVQLDRVNERLSSAIFYFSVALSIVVMLLVWAAAPFAARIMNDQRVAWVIVAMAVTMPISALASQHMALLGRRMEWVTIRTNMFASQIVALAVGVLLAWQTSAGYWAIVVSSWASVMTGTALAWWRMPWRPGKPAPWSEIRSKLGFGFHVTASQFIFWTSQQLDNVLVGARMGAAELGLYSRAFNLYMLPSNAINAPVQRVVLPALSRLQNRPDEWRRFLGDFQSIISLGTGAVAAFLIATADPLVTVVLGRQWGKSAELFQIMALAFPMTMMASTCRLIHISLGRTRRMFNWTLVRLPVVVIAYSIGIQYGTRGMAMAVAAVPFVMAIPGVFNATRGTPMSAGAMYRRAIPPWICMAGAIGLTWLIDFRSGSPLLDLIVSGACCTAIYAAMAGVALCLDPSYRSLRSRVRDNLLPTLRQRLPYPKRMQAP